MEPKGSLSWSQEPSTRSYPKTDRFMQDLRFSQHRRFKSWLN